MKLKTQSGFSLTEVMIGLAISSFLFFTIASMTASSNVWTNDLAANQELIETTGEMINYLQNGPLCTKMLKGVNRTGPLTFLIDPTAAGGTSQLFTVGKKHRGWMVDGINIKPANTIPGSTTTYIGEIQLDFSREPSPKRLIRRSRSLVFQYDVQDSKTIDRCIAGGIVLPTVDGNPTAVSGAPGPTTAKTHCDIGGQWGWRGSNAWCPSGSSAIDPADAGGCPKGSYSYPGAAGTGCWATATTHDDEDCWYQCMDNAQIAAIGIQTLNLCAEQTQPFNQRPPECNACPPGLVAGAKSCYNPNVLAEVCAQQDMIVDGSGTGCMTDNYDHGQ